MFAQKRTKACCHREHIEIYTNVDDDGGGDEVDDFDALFREPRIYEDFEVLPDVEGQRDVGSYFEEDPLESWEDVANEDLKFCVPCEFACLLFFFSGGDGWSSWRVWNRLFYSLLIIPHLARSLNRLYFWSIIGIDLLHQIFFFPLLKIEHEFCPSSIILLIP